MPSSVEQPKRRRDFVLTTTEVLNFCIEAKKRGLEDADKIFFSHESLHRELVEAHGVIDSVIQADGPAQFSEALSDCRNFVEIVGELEC